MKLVVDTLGGLHRLRNTYIIFTSDNGFFYGEHRLTGGKFLAYEPATHLPLLIRGPGIKPGTSTGELAANIDIAPTILELAGVEAGQEHRRPLAGALHAATRACARRRPILFESFVETDDVEANGEPTAQRAASRSCSASRPAADGASASIVAPPKDYEGIRLGPYKYIEWPDGEKELYDITKDPYELNNIVRVPNFFPIRAFLHAQLIRLETCVGRTCQEVAAEIPADPRASSARSTRSGAKKNGEREGTRRKAAPQTQQVEPGGEKRPPALDSLGSRRVSEGSPPAPSRPAQLRDCELLDDGEGVAAADRGALGDGELLDFAACGGR